MGRRVLIAALLALALPVGAHAAFPGADPAESPRLNAPNDPDFDRCEEDNDGGSQCGTYADEDLKAFGFSPDSANTTAPAGPHYLTGTRYLDCDQLDAQGKAANVAAEGVAGNPVAVPLAECLQIGGVRADTAWKYDTGNPRTTVAILDTGIRWQEGELRNKIRLNAAELPPRPDLDGNGVLSVDDFAGVVAITAGDEESDGTLDASDLIATYSDHTDADGNGYVDDIAGWDFFDDDNDPFDASSCCSANGHGTGRAREAVAATNNGQSGTGMCPDCSAAAAARVGHVRRADRQLRDGRDVRRRQRRERRRGRRGRSHEHPVRAPGVHLRGRQGARADARLLRHQQRQPQLPDELQRGGLRRRVALRHRAEQHLQRPAGHRAAETRRSRRRSSRPAARSSSACSASGSRSASRSPRPSSATRT